MNTFRDVVPVANQPKTPIHGFRIPDDLWEAVKRKAADEDVTVTEIVIRLLTRWVDEY